MPNLRGPSEKKRRLYSGVLTSVVMYAAPVWSRALSSSSNRIHGTLRRMQKVIAIRVIAVYRTISFDAATLLARMPPWALEAELRRTYHRIMELKRSGDYSLDVALEIRKEESVLLSRQWEVFLSRSGIWGKKTVDAVKPFLQLWIERKHGDMSFYITQMMTGHGSFGHFLWRRKRPPTPVCFHCDDPDDTVKHTLMECPVWESMRHKLVVDLELDNNNFKLKDIVGKILCNEENWLSFAEVAISIMRLKQEEESRRETLSSASNSSFS